MLTFVALTHKASTHKILHYHTIIWHMKVSSQTVDSFVHPFMTSSMNRIQNGWQKFRRWRDKNPYFEQNQPVHNRPLSLL